MDNLVLIGIFFVAVVAVSIVVLYFIEKLILAQISGKNQPSPAHLYDLGEQRTLVIQIRRIILVVALMGLTGGGLYALVHNTPQQGFVMEWINLLIRWVHVVAGIMWIGASFYFIFLENNLNRTDGISEELAGNLWAIHGGGFYFLEKYKVAPKVLPKTLHWFKYEAYFTWLSGFALLIVVYYMDANAFLIDPRVADISSRTGIIIGCGTLVAGWVIYDAMCKSPLVRNSALFAIVGFLLLVGLSWFLAQVFSSRAAYIHVGALLGTLMAWNVYFVIIPSQKSLVRAAITGRPLDPTLGKKAAERSLHNNYLTLPVIFIMISNHFPSTFGHQYNWMILIVLTLASAGIKHYWNLHERKAKSGLVLPISIAALIALAIVTSPKVRQASESDRVVPFAEIQTIFVLRCTQCHSAKPTDPQWPAAPNGVTYDTPEEIKKMSEKIMLRAVLTTSMPQGNKTNMTDAEREAIRLWILQGAHTDQ